MTTGLEDELIEVTGPIIQRRCLGKHLAFCHLRNGETEVQVLFKSEHLLDGQIFPAKPSLLPHGANMWLRAKEGHTNGLLCVVEWQLLDNPREAALVKAAVENSDGILYSTYLQHRAELFRLNNAGEEGGVVAPRKQRRKIGQQPKNQPAKLFAQFIVTHFHELNRVLDIAGGKGLLSLALKKYNVESVVIDPMIRKKQKTEHIATYFNDTFHERYPELLEEADCLVALHPDEATEDVVDMALQFNKSVAIVPCCVFPGLFPDRRFRNGENVTEYDDFCAYLLEKDDRLQKATLPFQGRNQVIYHVGQGRFQP